MALKSKPPSAGVSPGGQKTAVSRAIKTDAAVDPGTKTLSKRRKVVPVETIESRLERKAAVADTRTFAAKSLGQMSQEQRHKRLHGD